MKASFKWMNSKENTGCEKDRAYEFGEIPKKKKRVRERTRGKRNREKAAKIDRPSVLAGIARGNIIYIYFFVITVFSLTRLHKTFKKWTAHQFQCIWFKLLSNVIAVFKHFNRRRSKYVTMTFFKVSSIINFRKMMGNAHGGEKEVDNGRERERERERERGWERVREGERGEWERTKREVMKRRET